MLAYLNGTFLPLEHATVPVWDYGFTMGVAISEQLRTFSGRLHCLDFYLARLARGLEITGIDPHLSIEKIGNIVAEVAEKNFHELPAGSDLGIGITITAGGHAARAPAALDTLHDSTVLVYAMPLPFPRWADLYTSGIELSTVQTREIPGECIPRQLKCRSRMHYFLAENQATRKQPGSHALLLDTNGMVAEGTTASVLMVHDGTIIAPLRDNVLPSISVRFLETVICPKLGISFDRRDLTVESLHAADELLWLSTTACVLPISRLDGAKIGDETSRPMFERIIREWSNQVGIDIIEQAVTS
jgi:branched-subunit amino acid aminotransferase/4-amino-4-deoxychorismate lyase